MDPSSDEPQQLDGPKSDQEVPAKPLNVIIFGKTGTGKSSVLNMLMGSDVVDTADGASGVTFKSSAHECTIGGINFRLHDTIGLNEEHGGTTYHKEAIVSLYKLVRSLEEGVSLLVYCIRAGRVTDREVATNWQVFHGVICKREVPIVLLVTGCEEKDLTTEEWWEEEDTAKNFRNCQAYPNGAACITATRGKIRNDQGVYQQEYVFSKEKVEKLVLHHYGEPWCLGRIKWLTTIFRESKGLACWPKKKEERQIQLKEALQLAKTVKSAMMDDAEAEALVKAFDEVEKEWEEEEQVKRLGNTPREAQNGPAKSGRFRFWP